MATTADQPVNYQSPLAGILESIAGRRTSSTGNTTGSTAGMSGGTTTSTSTADLGPLNQIFQQASAGMSPEQLSALITSIFTEGANQVPSLIGAYANATGSRATGNSPTQLALDELNKSMSTQAVQALLNFNQAGQQTAANAAGNIANNTRQQTQQQVQQQTGTSNQQQTQQQQQTVNPKSSGLLATLMGGAGLANKFGLLPSFGKGAAQAATAGAASSPGTISGGGSLMPNGPASTPMLGGGAATTGMLSTPTASSGFLASPVAANPYGGGSMIGGGSGMGGGAPSYDFTGGMTGMGGFSSSGGMLGSGADLAFGGLPSGFNAFGTLGTESLGSNLDFGSNPYGYGGSAGGITGIMSPDAGWGGAFTQGIGNAWTGATDFLGGLLGGAGDFIGSFFADGGKVGDRGIGAPGDTRYGMPVGPSDPGSTMLRGNIFDTTRMRNEMQAGLMPMPMTMQQGTNVRVPQGTPTPAVGLDQMLQLLPFLLGQGMGFADGGQVQTGGAGPARIRNQNYLGPQQQRERSGAMNYEGYAPTPAVGASQPAGGSPTMAAQVAPMAIAPMAGTGAISAGDPAAQARAQYAESIARQEALTALYLNSAGGSGGVGEGGAPGQNEADNGQAGIGPSGIAAAPPGTTQGIGMASGLVGLPSPSAMLAFIAAMAAAVNAANQGMGGGGIGNDADDGEGSTAGITVGEIGVVDGRVVDAVTVGGPGGGATGVGASGGPGSGTDGGAGDSGVGGDSAGDGTSGSAGTSAGADGWADGGIVFGQGTGTSDSIKVKSKQPGGKTINYSDGEYVIPKDVVDALGASTFDDIIAAFHTPVNR